MVMTFIISPSQDGMTNRPSIYKHRATLKHARCIRLDVPLHYYYCYAGALVLLRPANVHSLHILRKQGKMK